MAEVQKLPLPELLEGSKILNSYHIRQVKCTSFHIICTSHHIRQVMSDMIATAIQQHEHFSRTIISSGSSMPG